MKNTDDEKDFGHTLYEAQLYFYNLYERCTGNVPYIKEKWGTIRYEHVIGWITSVEQARIFKECIMRTVRKFPSVAGAIADDARHTLYDEYFEGWCAGVTFQSNGTYWHSDKRPKGV